MRVIGERGRGSLSLSLGSIGYPVGDRSPSSPRIRAQITVLQAHPADFDQSFTPSLRGTLILARSSINRRLHSLGRCALRSSFLLCGDSCANARVFRQHRPAGTGKRHG